MLVPNAVAVEWLGGDSIVGDNKHNIAVGGIRSVRTGSTRLAK